MLPAPDWLTARDLRPGRPKSSQSRTSARQLDTTVSAYSQRSALAMGTAHRNVRNRASIFTRFPACAPTGFQGRLIDEPDTLRHRCCSLRVRIASGHLPKSGAREGACRPRPLDLEKYPTVRNQLPPTKMH